MLLHIGVDRLDARCPALGLHLVESVEQQEQSVIHQPRPAHPLGHLVLRAQFFGHPVEQRLTRVGPRREVEHHRDRLRGIGLGTPQKSTSQFQKRDGLARARRAENQHRAPDVVKKLAHGLLRGQHAARVVGQFEDLLPGMDDRLGARLSAECDERLAVDRLFEHALDPEVPDLA